MTYQEMQVARAQYQKATQPERERGATKATLAYRARMFGTCPDCGMRRSVCLRVGGCQPDPVSRGQMLVSVLRVQR